MPLSDHAKVNHELRRLGFGGLDDPNLITSIAFFIKDHEQFKKQLFSVVPEKRRMAYAQLRPHLRFTAKPLDVYEAEMKLMAEQQQLPTWDGGVYPKEFKVPEISLEQHAQEAIKQNLHEKERGLTLECAKCTAVAVFKASLRKNAEKDSHQAGWRSDGTKNWCPKCVPSRCTMTLDCSKCSTVQRIRAWDPQDGYSSARLRGWVIGDDATCPECAVKKLRLQ